MQDLAKRIAELSPEKLALLREELSKRKQEQSSLKLTPNIAISEFPLSYLQEGVWLSGKTGESEVTNSVPLGIRLQGPLQGDILALSVHEILKRHEILTTTFTLLEDKQLQKIAAPQAVDLKINDLAELAGEEQRDRLAKEIKELASLPFDLTNGPLYRVTLWRLAAREHLLLIMMHRIVFDNCASGIFIRDLAAFYEAFTKGSSPVLPEKPLRYADYAYWQRNCQEGMLEKSLSYWKQQLACASGLQLPEDRPRGALQTNRKAKQSLVIPQPLATELKEIGKKEGTTLFVALLAAFQFLLYRITGQEDICVGTPVSNRNRLELEELVGVFENKVILRANLSGAPAYTELLNRDRSIVLEAFAHQEAPLEKVLELLAKGDNSYHSLIRVMFSLNNKPVSQVKANEMIFDLAEVDTGISQYDLAFSFVEDPAELRGTLEYNSDLFDESSIIRVLGYFTDILNEVVKKPEIRLSEMGMTREYVNPKTEVEKALVEIWKEVLNFSQVGINDNFFEIGGNSLLLVRAHDRIELAYPGKITIAKLFSYPTIAKLARLIEGEKEKDVKELTLKYLPLPQEYWVAADEENDAAVFKFQLDDLAQEGMLTIAKDNEVDMNDISLGIFIYLLAEISGEQQLTIQTTARNNDEQACGLLPLNMDLAEIEDFVVLFKEIHQRQQNSGLTQTYSIDTFNSLRVAKPDHCIMPVFSAENVISSDLLDAFELVLKTDASSGQTSFSCEYNATLLKKDKVEELILDYKKLFNKIIERMN